MLWDRSNALHEKSLNITVKDVSRKKKSKSLVYDVISDVKLNQGDANARHAKWKKKKETKPTTK